ncbi:Hypothetical predicted protein [Paramuricea clavata]|uniref:Uncharacterized protein n=1 Tax=Paramuricea clavata TaxID=317549 RepID=A0A6S7I4G9_PARCT|nr:Hypothetical predicted protein [Paramuricea clavata]
MSNMLTIDAAELINVIYVIIQLNKQVELYRSFPSRALHLKTTPTVLWVPEPPVIEVRTRRGGSGHTSIQPQFEPLTDEQLEAHVNWVVTNGVPPSPKIKEIHSATHFDPVLCDFYKAIENQRTIDGAKFRQHRIVGEKLSITKGVILRGNRIMTPKSLQNKVIKVAHEGHQGLVKDKQLLRSRVWFPKMDDAVLAIVGPCIACQVL